MLELQVMRDGAMALMNGATAMSAAKTVAARTDAAWLMIQGSEAVRGLTPELSATARESHPNGHMFERQADGIADAAAAAVSGRNVGRAIGASLDGAKILMQREAAGWGLMQRAATPLPLSPQFLR
jgi:hypothetical protein